METSIYLIRHAQSHPSARLHYSEWPLSAVGVDQAENLSDLLEPLGIDVLFSSPFARCLQTVQLFAGKAGIGLRVKEELRERLVVKQMVDDFHEIWRHSWVDFSFALPECESSLDAQLRFVAAVRGILAANGEKTIGISTHGNVIGLFLNNLDQNFGREQTEALQNPDVVRIVVSGDRLVWDQEFRLPGLENIATDHGETPVIGQVQSPQRYRS